MATVLVTGVGGACGIGAVDSLRETTDHEVVGVDMDPDAAGLYLADRGRTVPAADDDDWPDAMREAVDAFGVDVVVPTVDEELPRLPELPEVPVVAPRPAVVDLALDKRRTHRRLATAGHAVPRTWPADEPGSVPESAFPLVLKPRRGRGSRGVRRIDEPTAVDAAVGRSRYAPTELLLQEFVEGREFTTGVVATGDGDLLAVVPKETMAKEGSTTKGVTRHDEAVADSCRRIFETLSPAGPINVQQIVDADGQPRTIEINPRFSSTSCLTVAAGVDAFDLLVRDALGETVTPPDRHEAGVYILRYDGHVFVDGGLR